MPHLHLFHDFLTNISVNHLNNYNRLFEWLYNKDFVVSRTNNLQWLNENGIMRRIEPYLTKVFIENRFAVLCNGLINLLMIVEPIYKELCVEFFATASFKENTLDANYRQALTFWLGG